MVEVTSITGIVLIVLPFAFYMFEEYIEYKPTGFWRFVVAIAMIVSVFLGQHLLEIAFP